MKGKEIKYSKEVLDEINKIGKVSKDEYNKRVAGIMFRYKYKICETCKYKPLSDICMLPIARSKKISFTGEILKCKSFKEK